MTSNATTGTTTAPADTPWAEAGLLPVAAPTVAGRAHVLTVGQGKGYATLGAATAAAQNGNVILVNAGTYTNDFATVSARVTIEGMGGMATFVATVAPPNLKGILTVDNDATIANLCFSDAAIDDADGGNGAGIRYEGGQMVLENDVFSHDQDGLLANAVIPELTTNTITIDHSVFSDNGSDSGYTHNLYVGAVTSLTATDSVFEGGVVGHEFKSRAQTNTITGNVFSDGPTGTASYDIDLPNGGNDTVAGNLIEKGPDAQNDAMVHFGGEGIPYAGSSLTVSGNDFVNDLGADAVGVLNQTAITIAIAGDMFTNLASGQIAQGPATETSNVDGNGNPLPDSTLVGVLPGSTLVITDVAAHSVTLDGTIQALEGGAGLLTVYAQAGHVIAVGGTGGLVLTESATSGGNPAVSVGPQGSVAISGPLGYLSVASNGGRASFDIVQGGAEESLGISGGAVSVRVYGGGTNVSTAGGSAGSILSLSAGTANVLSAGADTIQAGTGADTVIVSGRAQVHAGTGNLSVFGRGDQLGATVFGAASDTVLDGDTGNLTYVGGASASVVELRLSNNTLLGGAGHLTIHGGSRESLVGGIGGLTYLATDGGGADTITTAVRSKSLLQLAGADVVDSWGADTITGGSGNQSIAVHGNALLTGSTGNSTITLGGNDTLAGVVSTA